MSCNLYAYCKNNPVAFSDSNGHAPKWWQWAISGALVVAGAALVATGVGGVAGGALICAGVNSVIGSYVSEASGGSSVAGWTGGMVTGALCGLGAGAGGSLLLSATNMTGAACLGSTALSCATSFGSGALGSAAGTFVTAKMNGKNATKKEIINAMAVGGTFNMIAGIASGMGSGIASMSTVGETTKVTANAIASGWSLMTEVINDTLSTVVGWFVQMA